MVMFQCFCAVACPLIAQNGDQLTKMVMNTSLNCEFINLISTTYVLTGPMWLLDDRSIILKGVSSASSILSLFASTLAILSNDSKLSLQLLSVIGNFLPQREAVVVVNSSRMVLEDGLLALQRDLPQSVESICRSMYKC